MRQLSVILQESVDRETEARTILGLLRDQMDGVDSRRRRSSRTLSLKERLGLKGFGCCGATWGFRPTTISVREDDDDDDVDDDQELPQQQERGIIEVINNVDDQAPPHIDRIPDPDCLSPAPMNPTTSGMNLAAALAAERQIREGAITGPTNHTINSITAPGTPLRVSLMRLIEETDGGNGEVWGAAVESDGDTMCCVCMGRKKGAAYIPCGHTFCRVCSRELWLNRGSCPLCNRSILEILDIY